MRKIRETVFELDGGQRILTQHREGLTLDAEARKDRRQPGGRAVFQHRHFAEIARIIRELDGVPLFNRAEIAKHFAKELDASNVRFDRERFIRATED